MAQGRMGWRWQYVRQLRSVAGRMDKYQCDRQVRRHSSLPEAINTWRITRNPKWPNAGRWYWWNLDANYGIRRRGEVDTLTCKAFFNPDNWLCISLRSAPRSLASERQYYPGFVRKELQNKVISADGEKEGEADMPWVFHRRSSKRRGHGEVRCEDRLGWKY